MTSGNEAVAPPADVPPAVRTPTSWKVAAVIAFLVAGLHLIQFGMGFTALVEQTRQASPAAPPYGYPYGSQEPAMPSEALRPFVSMVALAFWGIVGAGLAYGRTWAKWLVLAVVMLFGCWLVTVGVLSPL